MCASGNWSLSSPAGCRSVMRENLHCDHEKLSIGDLVEWIYFQTVLILPNPEEVYDQLQKAQSEYQGLVGRTQNRWPYFFGLTAGNTMSWGSGKTYTTVKYPPALEELFVRICSFLPFADQTGDCLPTYYKNGKKSLNLHQDKCGEAYFGRRELVILLFAGDSRRLIIKREGFERTILCVPRMTVVLTPSANKIFYHGKLPSKSAKPSITFAFRRGIPPWWAPKRACQ